MKIGLSIVYSTLNLNKIEVSRSKHYIKEKDYDRLMVKLLINDLPVTEG